jgi:hypothetical protein
LHGASFERINPVEWHDSYQSRIATKSTSPRKVVTADVKRLSPIVPAPFVLRDVHRPADVDFGLALAADVDERRFRADRNDGAWRLDNDRSGVP